MKKKLVTLLKSPRKLYYAILSRLALLMSDRAYLKIYYYRSTGKPLDLNNPQTFNEKLQWLKLYDRNPFYTKLVDKYEVKEYVASKIGKEHIIKTLGVYDSFSEIDFDALPNQFVLKCTHDSGGIVICKDKKSLDIKAADEILTKGIKHNYYTRNGEWPYKNVTPRIIAEEYMEDTATSELRDYKFFCFNGVVRLLFVASDRQSKTEETKFDFFDSDYNFLPIINGHPNSTQHPVKPINFELMKEFAVKLSENIPHVRVDFYEVNGKVYFGEMTFYHNSGIVPFEPEMWDATIGNWLELPIDRK
jgi:hypothetical protein